MAVEGKVLVGAGGRVFSAAYGEADPPVSANVADLGGLGWTDLGIIADNGVTFKDEKTIQKIMGWKEKRPVRKLVSERSTTVSFAMRQWNAENLILALGGGAVDGGGIYSPSEDEDLPEIGLVVAWDDGDEEFLLYCPRGVAGTTISFDLKKDQNIELPVEFEVTADEENDDTPFYLYTNSQAFGSES